MSRVATLCGRGGAITLGFAGCERRHYVLYLEVIDRLEAGGIKTIPTGEHGTITAAVDVKAYEYNARCRNRRTQNSLTFATDWREDAAP
jgi:hypothetical protein